MIDAATYLRTLNPEQREAVEHLHGPILVLAGAGSGKTRVLATRIAHLIARHRVAPRRIFAVTFTNKAAGEMRERVGTLLEHDPAGLWIGTFHSLSARLLRREADRLGFSRDFTIYDEDDRLSLIRRVMEERNHSTRLFPPRVIQGLISGAKNRMMSAESLAASAPFDQAVRVAADVIPAMQGALRRANAMDFDDLMLHPLALFREHPDVLTRWQSRFDFLLVDEFQDTNRAQYQLVRQLAERHRELFAVGDDDQSIYGWRGAEVRNMRDMQRDFDPVTLVKLEENYRSTSAILEAANAVIARNAGRLGKTLRAVRTGGDSLVVLAAADERDEAEWIAGELDARRRAGMAWTEAAILYRTNAQSRALEEAMRRAGIPYRIVGAISFYDRREVKDLLAWLRLIANPRDDEAFLRASQVPRRGLGDTSLATLREQAREWHLSLAEAAGRAESIPSLRPNQRSALVGFADLIRDLAARVALSPPAVAMDEVIRAIDYEAVLLAEGLEGAERWENVRELLAAAADWSEVVEEEEVEASQLQQFLAQATLLSAVDSSKGEESGVTLMTLHTAKGLEWPVVVMSGMEEGLFPSGRALEERDGLEEERRLCYVGITRARDALILTWSRSRRRGGDLRPGIASRFLGELPPGRVQERTTSLGRGGPTFGGYRPPPTSRAAPSPRRQEFEPEESNQDAPRYVKGERVRHRRFGSGAILGLVGAGKNLTVAVAFDDPEIGTRQLVVAFAGLEREWESA